MASRIEDEELGAFQHALTQSIVGIVGKDDRGEFGTQIGTGTFVSWKGARYILTAEHVIRGCTSQELRFFLPTDGVRMAERREEVKLRIDDVVPREGLAIAAKCAALHAVFFAVVAFLKFDGGLPLPISIHGLDGNVLASGPLEATTTDLMPLELPVGSPG